MSITNNNAKVVWIYGGRTFHVDEMYDKPFGLCLWWIGEHQRDSQYAPGVLKVVSMMHEPTS